VRVITSMFMLHGETDEAAEEELAKIREDKDYGALENLIASFERDNRHTTADRTAYLRSPTLVGFGSGDPVTGTPETMARKLTNLIVESGIEGIHMTFVDFVEDLRVFGQKVLPLLKSMLAEHDIVVGQ
jgi:pyrimidine oxygenase